MAHEILDKLFTLAGQRGGSDIHIKPNDIPRIRIKGNLIPVNSPELSGAQTAEMVYSTLNEVQRKELDTTREIDYAYTIPEVGRFRMNAYYSLGEIGLVARVVNSEPIPLNDLGMPETVKDLANNKNGLIIVAGATGSGKSTTLAGIIDHINKTKPVNIVTIEDPIEYMHKSAKGLVVQRELYTDTFSMRSALKAVLREDPDVILIGEMRDQETVETAMSAAETGHLVLSTLHTTTAPGTINRIIDFFPADEHSQVRSMLSSVLRGVVCQRLVPTVDSGRHAALEIMINKGRIPEAIAVPGKYDAYKVISESHSLGMQTFEDHLLELTRNKVISPDIALRNSTKSHAMRMQLNAQKLG